MKILYIITRSDTIGGASIHLLELIKGFQSRGIEIHAVVGGDGVFYNSLREVCPFVYNIKSLKREINLTEDIKTYFSIKKLLVDIGPDLVHLHSAKAGILGRLVTKSVGVPNVYTVHGWPFTDGVHKGRAFFYKMIERFMMHKSDAIITVSEYDKTLAITNGFKKIDIIETVLNGVPSKIVPYHHREDNVIKLVMVARFDDQKDHETLLSALTLIGDRNWELELIGDGPNIEHIKTLSRDMFIDHKISFSGSCNDVYERLSCSDIFLLITNWEGLPLTILEAMSLSLPIIASGVGGVRETIISGSTGYVVNKDAKVIANRISYYLDNPEKIIEHGKSSEQYYNSKFTVKSMLDSTYSVYKRVLV